jgi:integrase
VDWDVIDRMPCAITLLPVPETSMSFYDFDEYERLVAAASSIDATAYLIVLLGGEAGLRCGEMIALEWRDVDLGKRQLCVQRSDLERPRDILYRWFVGLSLDEAVWDATTFTKNRDRLLDGDVADAFFTEVLAAIKADGVLSDEHFTVDGTLLVGESQELQTQGRRPPPAR